MTDHATPNLPSRDFEAKLDYPRARRSSIGVLCPPGVRSIHKLVQLLSPAGPFGRVLRPVQSRWYSGISQRIPETPCSESSRVGWDDGCLDRPGRNPAPANCESL